MAQKPVTYVLAGYDPPGKNSGRGAFVDAVAAFEDRAKTDHDVVILRPRPGESIEQVAARIKPPANVVVACHGGEDGTFGWSAGESVTYSRLFSHLPNGTQSVSVASCFGGTSMDVMGDLPPGAMLQSLVGRKVEGINLSIAQFAREVVARPEITQMSLMLEALDNVRPKDFEGWYKELDLKHDLNDVLPHTIGIGGHPPKEVNLDTESRNLATGFQLGIINKQQFDQALVAVREHFDGDAGGAFINSNDVNNEIDKIANMLRTGQDTSRLPPNEQRFLFAITIAHMQTSGQLPHMMGLDAPQQQQDLQQVPPAAPPQRKQPEEHKPAPPPQEPPPRKPEHRRPAPPPQEPPPHEPEHRRPVPPPQEPPPREPEHREPEHHRPAPPPRRHEVDPDQREIIQRRREAYEQRREAHRHQHEEMMEKQRHEREMERYKREHPQPPAPPAPPQPEHPQTPPAPPAPPQPEHPQTPPAPPAPPQQHQPSREERIKHANDAFGASADEIRNLQSAMYALGKNLGSYGDPVLGEDGKPKKDEHGNVMHVGNDGIHGKFTQKAWIETQQDLLKQGVIDKISAQYDPEIAKKIQEHAAEKIRERDHPVEEPQVAPPGQDKPPPTTPPPPEPPKPPQSQDSSTLSWMTDALIQNAPVCLEKPPQQTPDWMQTMTPATQQAVASQLAAARGENVSHDMEQSQAAGAAKERTQSASRQ